MIPCKKCGYQNSLTTMFCHGCGSRIEVSYGQVASSVAATNLEQRDLAILGWGRSAVPLACFLLICALVLRYVAVPTPPPASVPAAADVALLNGDPAWAASATPVEPTAATAPTANAGRLAWRQSQGPGLLSAFSIDLKPLRAAQKTLLAAQKADGSFAGEEPMGATALAALALQAWPATPELVAGAAKARAWIDSAWNTLPQRSSLTRALSVAALVDAEALSDERRTRLGVLLVDGSAPLWQALTLPLYTAEARPKEVIALQNKLTAPLWAAWFQLCAGKPVELENALIYSEAAANLATAEERFLWAQVAWLHPVAPDDYATTLRAWAAAAPAKPEPATAKACGPTAASALFLLVATAPLRMPALALSR